MIVKTFNGASLRDALRQVRETFGADAVILDTKFESPGANRVGGVIVTAAHEGEPEITPGLEGAHTLHLKGAVAEEPQSPVEAEPEPPALPDVSEIEDEAAQPPTQTGERRTPRAKNPDAPIVIADDPTWPLFRQWLGSQSQLAAGLIETFTTHLTESLPTPDPFLERRLKGQVIMFVGSHGAGKSTALFKALAARWRIRQRKPHVALLASNTETRVDWLTVTCAECDIPCMRHAMSGAKLPVKRPKRGDDLFVEFSRHTQSAVWESDARAIRRALKPDTVVLVLNAGASADTWHKEFQRYALLAPTHALFTHWDEHTPWWDVWTFLRSHPVAGSYRTAGHDLIGDILPLTATDLQTGIADHLNRCLDWRHPAGPPTAAGVHRFATIESKSIRTTANSADNKG